MESQMTFSMGDRLNVPQSLPSDVSHHSNVSEARYVSRGKILPPCRVCGSAASGFHYGCNTCEACKGFFRRALNRSSSFRCKANGMCTIKGNNRSLCAYCRFQRCLSLGMSKGAIKTGRYTHEKRTRDTLEVREGETSVTRADVSSRMQQEAATSRTMQEEDATARMTQEDDVTARVTHAARQTDFLSTCHRSLQDIIYLRLASENKLLANGEVPFEHFINDVCCDNVDQRKSNEASSAPTSVFDITEVHRIVGNYIQFGRSVPGFCALCPEDQAMLFRQAWVEVSFLGNAFSGNLTPEICREEGDVSNSTCCGDLISRLARTLRRLERLFLTSQELALTQVMCLTFSDRGELQAKDKVEAIHWLVVRCLLNTLRRNHGDCSGQKFSEIISMLTSLRDISQEVEQLKRRETTNLC